MMRDIPPSVPLALDASPKVVVGELVALSPDGGCPIVRIGERAAALARSTVNLQGQHVGRSVVLSFEDGDPQRPIIMGVLQPASGWPDAQAGHSVEMDADGQRLVVTAKQQLVLRCGKASITLTQAGKVLIEGAYVTSRSSGVNRIKGASVQLN